MDEKEKELLRAKFFHLVEKMNNIYRDNDYYLSQKERIKLKSYRKLTNSKVSRLIKQMEKAEQ